MRKHLPTRGCGAMGAENIFGGGKHVMNSLISQFLTSNYYFLHLTSKYSPKGPSFKYTKSMLFN
jgi:hypothetical protein